MRPQDMNRFQATMAALAEVFSKQLSPPLTDLYWEALKSMTVEQFQEGAKSWIKIGKHFPKPAEILERFRELDDMVTSVAPAGLPPLEGKWLRLVNGLFLQYLGQRRLKDNFKGDLDIASRRRECLVLASAFESEESDGSGLATVDHLREQFAQAMRRIPDQANP
jgi:hypothetical protein